MPVRDLALRLAAGTTYAVNPYRATKVPTSFERLVMNRLGCGYARSTWQEMMRTGGAEAWFEQQLDPKAVPESATAEALTSWFPDLLDSHSVCGSDGAARGAGGTPATWPTGRCSDASTRVGRCGTRRYNSALHTTGAVQVLGFTAGNATADGSQLTVQYLKYLANHPATARTVARRIATRFVSDSPSDALVNDLARVFLDSGTDIKAVLRRLAASSEFRGSAGQKTRTPVEDLVAGGDHRLRVLGHAQ